MGTRINVLFEHRLPDYRNRATIVSLLGPALPAALAVCEYWRQSGSDPSEKDNREWTALEDFHLSQGSVLPRYKGPGSLFISFNRYVVHLRTGGRWRGFLSNEALRRVHMAAFRAIATSFGATDMALYRDDDLVGDAFFDSKPKSECIELMTQMWGPPQPSIESVDPKVVAETEHCPPAVWYLEVP
jgi:hypothetical protein